MEFVSTDWEEKIEVARVEASALARKYPMVYQFQIITREHPGFTGKVQYMIVLLVEENEDDLEEIEAHHTPLTFETGSWSPVVIHKENITPSGALDKTSNIKRNN